MSDQKPIPLEDRLDLQGTWQPAANYDDPAEEGLHYPSDPNEPGFWHPANGPHPTD